MAPATRSKSQFTLPPDYTFAPDATLIHKDGYARLERIRDAARNRESDRHNMYIYNDFLGYGILDLIDETLSSIHTFIARKKYLNAWRLLDCLCKFTDEYPDWQNVDDGERVIATVKAFGAMLMTTLRGLDQSTPSLLNEDTLPELDTSLETASRVFSEGNDWEEPYNKGIRAYGLRIFGERTPEERTERLEARSEVFYKFVCNLTEEEREKRNVSIASEQEQREYNEQAAKNCAQREKEKENSREEHNADEEDEACKPWYGDVNVKYIESIPRCFRVSPTWKAYKDILSESPRLPFRGPPIWDLTEWTAEEKKPFLFDTISSF